MKMNQAQRTGFVLTLVAPLLCASPALSAMWSVSASSDPFAAPTTLEGTFDLSDSQVFSNLNLTARVESSIAQTIDQTIGQTFVFTNLANPPSVINEQTIFVTTTPRAQLGLSFTPSPNNQTGRSNVFFVLTLLSEGGTTAFQSGGNGVSQIIEQPSQSTPEPAGMLGLVAAGGVLAILKNVAVRMKDEG
jgi:hypothetical protein